MFGTRPAKTEILWLLSLRFPVSSILNLYESHHSRFDWKGDMVIDSRKNLQLTQGPKYHMREIKVHLLSERSKIRSNQDQINFSCVPPSGAICEDGSIETLNNSRNCGRYTPVIHILDFST